jgi:hypothetical protein
VLIASVVTLLAGLLMPAVRAEGLEHDASVAADAEVADAAHARVAADAAGRATT